MLLRILSITTAIIGCIAGMALLFQTKMTKTQLSIHTDVEIEASPQVVWNALVDLARYGDWNPYHVSVTGIPEVGHELTIKIQKPNGNDLTIRPHVMRLIPSKELTWGGGIRRVFIGEHSFRLIAKSDGSTRLLQVEEFSGLAVPFLELGGIEEGYRRCNEALKKYLEK